MKNVRTLEIAAVVAVLVLVVAAAIVGAVAADQRDRADKAEQRLAEVEKRLDACDDALGTADEVFSLTADMLGYVSLYMDGDFYSITTAADGMEEVSGQIDPLVDDYLASAGTCRGED